MLESLQRSGVAERPVFFADGDTLQIACVAECLYPVQKGQDILFWGGRAIWRTFGIAEYWKVCPATGSGPLSRVRPEAACQRHIRAFRIVVTFCGVYAEPGKFGEYLVG